jgi:hypothetical protein
VLLVGIDVALKQRHQRRIAGVRGERATRGSQILDMKHRRRCVSRCAKQNTEIAQLSHKRIARR